MKPPNSTELDKILEKYLVSLKAEEAIGGSWLIPRNEAKAKIQELITKHTESAMLRQRVYDQKLINEARIEELNRLYNLHNKFFEKDSCEIIKDRIKALSREGK